MFQIIMREKLFVNYKKMAKSKSSKLSNKYIEILEFLNKRPEGVRAESIEKFFNLANRTAYNRLSRLKDLELIENVYPIWRIAKKQGLSLKITKLLENSKKHIQGHKFSFTLRLISKPDWWEKRENKLIKLKEFHFKNVRWSNNPYEQLLSDDFLIQTFKNSIVFTSRKKYWSNNPYDAFLEALDDALEMLGYLENKVKFKFYIHGVPQFSVRSQHLVKLKDSVAERCKKEGNKYEVVINNERRVLVDLSDPFGREAVNKDYAPEDLKRLQDRDADILKNDPSLNSDIDKRINNLTNNQSETNQNLNSLISVVSNQVEMTSGLPITLNKLEQQIISHLKLIQEYRKENVSWRKGKIKEIKKELKEGTQKKLGDF